LLQSSPTACVMKKAKLTCCTHGAYIHQAVDLNQTLPLSPIDCPLSRGEFEIGESKGLQITPFISRQAHSEFNDFSSGKCSCLLRKVARANRDRQICRTPQGLLPPCDGASFDDN
jgi:hypothetical protein